MNNIKVIMCDLDGTLLCENGYVSEKTIQAIKQIKKQGILFGIATGRDITTCENLFEEWRVSGLVDLIIGGNGVHIKDYKLHKEEITHQLDGAIINEIMHYFDDMDVNFCICKDGYMMMPKDDDIARYLSEIDKIPYQVADYDELLKEAHNKLLVVCREDMMEAVKQRASEHQDPRFVSMDTAPILYEYMDYRISKANGLKMMMEHHGWNMENLMVFGDANNDYEMMKEAGVGVCMINGCDRVKAVADHITVYDNNHDGIGKFLTDYFS